MKIAIIGAGASGLMCACMLPTNLSVTVFDKNPSSGKKLLLTGKTKCNLTNLCSPKQFLESVPQNPKFLTPSLHKFTPSNTIKFFESIGVKTLVKDNNRVFPNTGGANSIKQAMQNFAISRGITFKFNTKVTTVEQQDTETNFTVNTLDISNEITQHCFDIVIIATGGMSFPGTGSTGDGYEFAKSFGHDIATPRPSLCGLQFRNSSGISGQTIFCGVQILDRTYAPVTKKQFGNMLFTKHGVSGPVIFNAVSTFKSHSIKNHFLQIDFLPNTEKHPQFDPKDKPFYAFKEYLPTSVANWLAKQAIHPAEIKNVRIPISDFDSIETATITRGGIAINNINSETMESKLVPNLFFIGEVLDVDAFSGGFNLQIAFCTAVACAKNFIKFIKEANLYG